MKKIDQCLKNCRQPDQGDTKWLNFFSASEYRGFCLFFNQVMMLAVFWGGLESR